MKRIAIAALVLLTGLQLQSTEAASDGAKPGYAALVQQVAPSVVSVLVEEQGQGAAQRAADRALARNNEESDAVRSILERLLTGPGRSADSGAGEGVLGSGFIVSPDGLIVTNNHVVTGARAVKVKMADGREFPAEIVGTDPATDIALLRVNAGRLSALKLGSSEKTSVGDAVIAIGNPYGLGQTVTAGIISARGRTLQDDPYIDFLQTDAAINRGNSGGPLLSTDGAVLGVTSVIFSPSGGSVGLGFAIPAETVATVISELKAHGHVERGYLGISAQQLTPAIAKTLGVKGADGTKPVDGALITSVDPSGPADKILLVGDVLLSIGSKPVSFLQLPKRTARLTPGSDVVLVLVRDGVQLSTPFKVGKLPDPPIDPTAGGGADTWVPALALGLAETTPQVRKAIKSEDEPGGLIVTQIRAAGAGGLAGLKIGDLITHAGTKQLTSVNDLMSIDTPTNQMPLLLRVVRDGTPSFVAVTGSDAR